VEPPGGHGRDLEGYKPYLNELNELRLFINDALDILRRRYTCTLRGFGSDWGRITLKKTKDAVNTEIKTPYGVFNDAVEEFVLAFEQAAPLAQGENPHTVYKYISHTLLTKCRRALFNLPATGRTTITHSSNVEMYLNSCVEKLLYGRETRLTNYKIHLDSWRAHAKTLELVVEKLENTIE
jgi:hypothetical protein